MNGFVWKFWETPNPVASHLFRKWFHWPFWVSPDSGQAQMTWVHESNANLSSDTIGIAADRETLAARSLPEDVSGAQKPPDKAQL